MRWDSTSHFYGLSNVEPQVKIVALILNVVEIARAIVLGLHVAFLRFEY